MTYQTPADDKNKYSGEYLTPGDALSIVAKDTNAIKSIEKGVDDVIKGNVRTHPNPKSLRDLVENSEPRRDEQ